MEKNNSPKISITFLGTGTSQGIPVIACNCNVCGSGNKKDKRLRSSVLIHIENFNVVIDAGPDFRQQMLSNNVQSLRAILLTHEHVDHIFGLDDIRSFNWIQKRPMEIYAEDMVETAIKRIFSYVFAKSKYPGIPRMKLTQITNSPFFIDHIQINPIRAYHHKLPVFGFRIADFAYLTDINRIDKNEMEKLAGLKVLVINALRKEEHISHYSLKEALMIIEELKPEKAFLTHISHQMGFYDQVTKELPINVFLAYDGLKIKV